MPSTTGPRLIALGNEHAGDDGAALEAARRAARVLGDTGRPVEIVLAGRPGAGLVDLLAGERPVVLVDVVRSGAPAGHVLSLPLAEVAAAALAGAPASSHGFGPAEALQLARALGRPLPPGQFVGIEGAVFEPGTDLSPALSAALDDLVPAIVEAVVSLG